MYKAYEENNFWGVVRPVVDTVIALIWLGVFIAVAVFLFGHWNDISPVLHKAIDLVKELIDYAKTV